MLQLIILFGIYNGVFKYLGNFEPLFKLGLKASEAVYRIQEVERNVVVFDILPKTSLSILRMLTCLLK